MSATRKFFLGAALAAFLTVPAFSAFAENAESAKPSPSVVAPSQDDLRYTTTAEMKDDIRLTRFCLNRLHLSQKKVDATDMNAVLKKFASTLDPSRSFFRQSDYTLMCARFAPALPYFLEKGNIASAFTIYETFRERVSMRIEWIQKRLENPLSLDGNATLKLNRKDDPWFQSEEESHLFWEQRLTNDLINELLSEKSAEEKKAENANANDGEKLENAPAKPADFSEESIRNACKKIAARYQKLGKNLVLEPWEIEELFLNALAAQFDPHTTFFTKQSMEEFQISMRNSLCGIGAVLSDDEGYCTIREILPGGPVDRSGKFSVGDRIVAVGTGTDESAALTDVIGMRLNRIVRMLRGQKGEVVRLLVESGSDHSDRKYISLIRDEVKLTEQLASAKVIDVPAGDQTIPVGVITLPSFYGKDRNDKQAFSTSEDVKELLGKLKDRGVRAVILDLRENGGGYLNEAVDLTELFVGSGEPVVQVRGLSESDVSVLKTGRKTLLDAAKNIFSPSLPDWNGPLIVLVSKASASASEIVAGALRDNGRALIVGDPQTHGKGSVQEVMPYSYIVGDDAQKASIKITRSKWYAPSGNSIQLKGVASDIAVPSAYSVLPIAESDLDNPLPWDSIRSVLPENRSERAWLEAPISQELIDILQKSSQKRQAELPEFVTLNQTIAWWDRQEKDKTVPLNINERLEQREADKAFFKWIKDEYTEFAKNDFASTEIKLDSAIEQEKISEESKAKQAKSKLRRNTSLIPGQNSDEEEETPHYDIILREAARIAADWTQQLAAQKSGK